MDLVALGCIPAGTLKIRLPIITRELQKTTPQLYNHKLTFKRKWSWGRASECFSSGV